LNIFYSTGEDPHILWQFVIPKVGWTLKITQEGVYTAIFTSFRIVALILVSSLLTYTTTPSLLTTGLEKLLSPLEKIKVPVGIFAMMMTLALRFVPTLVEEADRIVSAQKARGANFETGSIAKRAKAFIPVLVPLFVSAFRRASELAFAMESRCYTGSNARTSFKQLHMRARDFVAIAVVLLVLGGTIVLNHFFVKIL
jgi:energy-coupling factor transport system permease protein